MRHNAITCIEHFILAIFADSLLRDFVQEVCIKDKVVALEFALVKQKVETKMQHNVGEENASNNKQGNHIGRRNRTVSVGEDENEK